MIGDEVGRRQTVGIATCHLARDVLTVSQSGLQLLPLIPQPTVPSTKSCSIESLYLARLPEDLQSLSLLPNLTTLRLSSAAAQAAPEHSELYERYTLIVAGGEEP